MQPASGSGSGVGLRRRAPAPASGSEFRHPATGSDADVARPAPATAAAVHVPSFCVDEMVDRLQRAWEVEPGYSKTAIVNAVTRAAHTEEWRSWTTSEDLERVAGELLYARVWNVGLAAGADA